MGTFQHPRSSAPEKAEPRPVFAVGQRLVCQQDLFMEDGPPPKRPGLLEDGPRAFTAGMEYDVTKVAPDGNVCIGKDDQGTEHWLGIDEEGDLSWARHFKPAEVKP